jgi:hypothetical protein
VTTLWLAGLPGVLCARDLFATLAELTEGLVRVQVPQNPE